MPLIPTSADAIPTGTAQEPRIGSRVSTRIAGADVAILGAADDSSDGPAAIRRALYGLTIGISGELGELQIADLGDVDPGTDSEIEAAIADPVRLGAVCIVLGSSRSISGAHSGLFAARPGRGAIVHVDRSLGVSPDGPFRRVIDRLGTRVSSYVALGVQTQHDSKTNADYLRSKGARFTTLDDLRGPPGAIEKLKRELGATIGTADFAAVNLDLRSASITGGDGLSVDELARFADQAGRHPKVQLLSVAGSSEPRLIAHWLWKFLLGVVQR